MLDANSYAYMKRLYAYVHDRLPEYNGSMANFSRDPERRLSAGLTLLTSARDAEQKKWAIECALGRPLGHAEKVDVVRLHQSHAPPEKYYRSFGLKVTIQQAAASRSYTDGAVTKRTIPKPTPKRINNQAASTAKISSNGVQEIQPAPALAPYIESDNPYTPEWGYNPEIKHEDTPVPVAQIDTIETITETVPEKTIVLPPRNGSRSAHVTSGVNHIKFGSSRGEDFDKDRPYRGLIKMLDGFARSMGFGGIEQMVRTYVSGSNVHHQRILAGIYFPDKGAMIFSQHLKIPRRELENEIRYLESLH